MLTEDLNTTSHALKEWAVAIKALEAGKTIMLLRKGGIHERGGSFHVAQKEVLLYPTYEHQQAFMLKSEYSDIISPVTPGWRPGTVRVSSWASITDILPIDDESIVNSLLPFHIWNKYFICDRLRWKPSEPLYILLLRTYKLPQTQEIPYRREYGGCKSWIDLFQTIDISNSTPILADYIYSQLVEEIRSLIGDKLYASSV